MSAGEETLEAEDRLVRAAATQLYAGGPAEFVAARTALVRSAKAEGEKEAAKRIGALRRPSVAAWALNQLVHRADPVIEELADLGARLRHATSTLDAAGLAGLRGARDATLASLVAAARAVAADEGQKLTPAVEAEVRDTGIAALADETAEAVLRSGTLTRALSYSGFGEVDVSESAATTSTGVVLTSIRGGRSATDPTSSDAMPEARADAVGDDADGEEAAAEPAESLAEALAAEERARHIADTDSDVEHAHQEVGRRRAAVDAARNRTEATRQRIQKLEEQLERARAEDDVALQKLTEAVSSSKQADQELAAARARRAALDD